MTQATDRLSSKELAAYWSGLSERFLEQDAKGLAVICYAGMPRWFNSFLDRYQRLALERLTRDIDFRGARVLDIGTGVGRWARWFADRGAANVCGVDLEQQRLNVARVRTPFRETQYELMSADRLAFLPETFDIVNSITVLQHVDRAAKEEALGEMARVLRPGGHAVLFELTDLKDDAPHVFPETASWWTDAGRRNGLRAVRVVGEQYTPLVRLAKTVAAHAPGTRGRMRIDEYKEAGPGRSVWHPATLALRGLVLLSYPIEEACQRWVPASIAKITGLLLRKDITTGEGSLS